MILVWLEMRGRTKGGQESQGEVSVDDTSIPRVRREEEIGKGNEWVCHNTG